MDAMIRTAMAIEGEIADAKSIQDAGIGRRVNLLRVQESDRGLLFPEDHRDRVEAIRAKARVGARARQGRCFVSSASSLDI